MLYAQPPSLLKCAIGLNNQHIIKASVCIWRASALDRHFLPEAEQNHKNLSRDTGNQAKIRTWYVPIASLECYEV
jgi:hypothetical protein